MCTLMDACSRKRAQFQFKRNNNQHKALLIKDYNYITGAIFQSPRTVYFATVHCMPFLKTVYSLKRIVSEFADTDNVLYILTIWF